MGQRDLATRLLKFELRLKAYEKLHTEELAELWQALDQCKREIAAAPFDREPGEQPHVEAPDLHPDDG